MKILAVLARLRTNVSRLIAITLVLSLVFRVQLVFRVRGCIYFHYGYNMAMSDSTQMIFGRGGRLVGWLDR